MGSLAMQSRPCLTHHAAPTRPSLTQLGANAMERKVLLITKEERPDVTLAGRNIAKLTMNTASAISVFDVLNADHIIIEDEALAHVQSFYGAAAPASA